MPTPTDFSNFQFGADKSAERQDSNLGTGGDYGQVSNAPATLPVAENTYPNIFGQGYDPSNRMFSQDKNNEPQQLASETAENQSRFAELQDYLMNSPYTLGSRVCHAVKDGPWTPPHPEDAGPGTGKTGE